MIERTIPATTHGRDLVVPPASPGPAPVLVGFHGYAEGAEAQLERMRAIPGAARWMTRQHRDLAIHDNIAYVASVVDLVCREWPTTSTRVYAGFSQGVAMAFRAAAAASPPASGVIAVGGDVPPEIEPAALRRIAGVLLCHGRQDPLYTPETFERDLQRLRDAAVGVRSIDFEGGHEWAAGVLDAAAAFLDIF